MKNKINAVKTAGIMIILTLLAKVAGMLRDVLFASLYGTGGQATAFLTASRIPLLFFDITLGAAIASSFIPVFNEYLETGKKEKALRYANTFINLILLITGIFCAAGMLFSRPITSLIGSGLAAGEKALAAKLVVVLFPTMIFTALAFALAGLLQSFGEFNIPAAISLASNGAMVLYLVLVRDRLGIEGVAVAMLISWGLQVVIQLPALKKTPFRYRPVLDLKDEGIKKTVLLALPILISSWVQPINSMVNIYLASFLNGGQAVAALDYANKLYIIFVGVLTYAISNLIFPELSRLEAGNKTEELAKLASKAAKTVLAVILPVMTLFLLLRTPLVRFVYERGEFGAESTALTASALLFYSLGMAGFAVTEILNKVFYATKDGRTPMLVAMGGILLNIVLSFLFVRWLGTGLWGVALAASISATAIGSALLIILNKRLRLFCCGDLVNTAKLLLSSCVMAICVIVVRNCFPSNGNFFITFLTLAASATVGLLVYGACLFFFKTEESADLKDMIKQKTKKVN